MLSTSIAKWAVRSSLNPLIRVFGFDPIQRRENPQVPRRVSIPSFGSSDSMGHITAYILVVILVSIPSFGSSDSIPQPAKLCPGWLGVSIPSFGSSDSILSWYLVFTSIVTLWFSPTDVRHTRTDDKHRTFRTLQAIYLFVLQKVMDARRPPSIRDVLDNRMGWRTCC